MELTWKEPMTEDDDNYDVKVEIEDLNYSIRAAFIDIEDMYTQVRYLKYTSLILSVIILLMLLL